MYVGSKQFMILFCILNYLFIF